MHPSECDCVNVRLKALRHRKKCLYECVCKQVNEVYSKKCFECSNTIEKCYMHTSPVFSKLILNAEFIS